MVRPVSGASQWMDVPEANSNHTSHRTVVRRGTHVPNMSSNASDCKWKREDATLSLPSGLDRENLGTLILVAYKLALLRVADSKRVAEFCFWSNRVLGGGKNGDEACGYDCSSSFYFIGEFSIVDDDQ